MRIFSYFKFAMNQRERYINRKGDRETKIGKEARETKKDIKRWRGTERQRKI